MTIGSVADYVNAINDGAVAVGHFRKVPSQASVAGWWADLSMASGSPVPNYYAAEPLVFDTLSPYRGIYHGPSVSPSTKVMTHLELMTPTAGFVGQFKVLDYLGYYPFLDLDEGAEQVMDNTVTLPRYADGDGVMAMLVAVAPTVGGGTFTFNYVDQAGDAKTSPVQYCGTTGASIASLVTSQPATVAGIGPFLRLADGSTGIRRVTSVQMGTLNGGLAALVLVKPLADVYVPEVNTPNEIEWVSRRAGPPVVQDGAHLNLIVNCAATIAAGLLVGRANFAWS